MEQFTVWVKTDDNRRIIAVNSSEFLSSFEGWTQIDSGTGDRYHHAQGNYFPKPLMDDEGAYQYKLVDGCAVERTEAEKAADMQEDGETPSPAPSDFESRLKTAETGIAELSETLDMILSGVTEDG